MQYCVGANYYWLLVEGLYLHNLLALVAFSEQRFFCGYLLIGWGKHKTTGGATLGSFTCIMNLLHSTVSFQAPRCYLSSLGLLFAACMKTQGELLLCFFNSFFADSV